MVMKSVFSVSQPRAGHHVVEMMLRAVLGRDFRYCEFYTEPNCCKSIPCVRRTEFGQAGYALFIQKSHDHRLTDPVPTDIDLILVQIREPTYRVLSNYELDLEVHKQEHSEPLLQYFLASEASYVINFAKKWLTAPIPNRLVLKYEDLLSDPAQALKRMFAALDMPISGEAIQKGAALIRVSSRDHTEFTARTFESSKYFVYGALNEFMHLLYTEASYLNYPLWAKGTTPGGPVTNIFRAQQALGNRKFDCVLYHLEKLPPATRNHPLLVRMRADSLFESGQQADAEASLEELTTTNPRFLGAYIGLASYARRQQDPEKARQYLRAALAQTGNVGGIREFLHSSWPDDVLLRELAKQQQPVTRDDVREGFRWILGRPPESDRVVDEHMRCLDALHLRNTLLDSQEFRQFYEKLAAGLPVDRTPTGEPALNPEDVAAAFRWILGRKPETEATIATHLQCRTATALRRVLLASNEFKRAYLPT